MTYSPLQIEAIRIFGRKELTEGCIVQWTDMQGVVQNTKFLYKESEYSLVMYKGKYAERATAIEDFKILGHIPHGEDLFRVAEEKGDIIEINKMADGYHIYYHKASEEGFKFPKLVKINPTLPLLDQPNLSDILNLFK